MPEYTGGPHYTRSQRGQVERHLAELDRAARLSRIAPSPPREVIAKGTLLRWKGPQDHESGVYTHFRIYAPGDGDDKIVRQLPADQLFLQDGLSGKSIFVSTYNATTEKESPRIPATGELHSIFEPIPQDPAHIIERATFNVPGLIEVNSGLGDEDGIYYWVCTCPTGYHIDMYEYIGSVSHAPVGGGIAMQLYRSATHGLTWTVPLLTTPLVIPDSVTTSGFKSQFFATPMPMLRGDRLRLGIGYVGNDYPGANLVVNVRYTIVKD